MNPFIAPQSLAAQGRSLPPLRETLPLTSKVAASTLPAGISQNLGRILRPQAAYRWLMPQIASITPAYIEQTLRGALAGSHVQAWELFDLMIDTWPELASCVNELIEGVQSRKMVFEAYHEEDEQPSDDAVQKCKVVSAALRRMKPDACADENDLNGTVKDILSAWFVGQAVLEVNWDAAPGSEQLNIINCGSLGDITAPRSTFWVHPVCYAWGEAGRLGLRGELGKMRDQTRSPKKAGGATPWNSTTYQPRPTDIIDFPPEKFLVGIHKAKAGTALAGALLRPLAWWWCALNFSANWALNFAQLFGLPIRVGHYDPSAAPETVAKICDMLANMGSATWAAFPAGTTIELTEASKGGADSPQVELMDRCDRYARSLILGQTMSGSQDASKGGGKAFGAVEQSVKENRIDAAGQFAAGVINTQLAASILRLNFGDDNECPIARFLAEAEGDVEDATIISTLAGAGMQIPTSHLHKKFNIPKPGKDEETIGGSGSTGVAPVPTGVAPGGFKPKPAMNAKAIPLDASDASAQLANTVLEDLTGVQEKWLGGLKPIFHRLIALAQSGNVTDEDFAQAVERARKEMPELFPKLDTDVLQDALEKAMGAAVVNGAVEGELKWRVRA